MKECLDVNLAGFFSDCRTNDHAANLQSVSDYTGSVGNALLYRVSGDRGLATKHTASRRCISAAHAREKLHLKLNFMREERA